MKAITMHQPWALLLARSMKRYETRSWSTKYRGPIAIHAGKSTYAHSHFISDTKALLTLESSELLHTVGHRNWPLAYSVWCWPPEMNGVQLSDFVFGAILAVGELTDCIPWTQEFDDELDTRERVFGNYGPGRYVWQIDNVRQWEFPFRTNGQQGLWNWTAPDVFTHAN